MEKAFSRVSWQNEPSVSTPLNQTNLNKGDSALDIIDDRVVAMDSRLTQLEEYEPTVISYAQAAENSKLNSEAYAVGQRNGTDVTSEDAAYHNNSKYYSEQAGTSASGAATSKQDSEAYAVGQRNGTDVTSEDEAYHNNSKYYSEQASSSATSSASSASDSADSAEDSEAWAVGKRNGVDVSSSDDTYHNNSKYYSEQSGSHVEDAEAWATGKRGGTDVGSSDETYHNNSKYYKEQAATSATNASSSATEAESYAKGGTNTRTGEDTDNADYYRGLAATSASNAASSKSDAEAYAVGKRNGTDVTSGDEAYHNNAKYYSGLASTSESNAATSETNASNSASASEDSAEDSEAWAIGKRDGVDVPSTDETYHNNAKYWAGQAEAAAAGGVLTFNSRSGYVSPLADDYSIDMITPTTGAAEGKLVGVDANGELNAIYDGGHKILNENGTQFTQRSKLKFLNAEVTDDSTNDTTIVTVQGGGVALSDVSGATITTVKRSVSITWTDPTDVIVDGTTLATWAGTIVVRKKGSAPQNKMDGIQIVDETVRNTYSSSALTDTLDYDGTYYYRFFPYSTTGSVTKGSSVTSTPERVAITTVPTPSTVTYDGTSQSPTWSNYDSDELTIGGDTYGTTSGTYTATFTPTYDYKWSDDSASKSVNWTIDKAAITPPTVTDTAKTYNGSLQSVTVSAYDSDIVTVTGVSGTNADSYTVTMSLVDTSNYEWSDSSTSDKTVSWSISKLELAVPTQSGSLVFDNTPQLPTWSGYDSDYMTKTETAQTVVGTYSTTFALIDTDNTKFVGTDNTSVSVSWAINDAIVEIPTVTGTSKTYTGSEQSVTISTYDSNIIEVTGASATNAGSYMVTMHLKNANYKWSDTTTSDKTVPWSIAKATLTIPTVTDTSKTYNGSVQSPSITGFDSNTMTKVEDSATNAGSYTLMISIADTNNYVWSDSTNAVKTYSWSIAKDTLLVPTVTDTSKTYNGSAQSPTIAAYDTTKLTVSGNSATNAGNYTVVFALVDSDNYQMSGTNNVAWSIAKATPTVSLSTSSASLSPSNTTATITVTKSTNEAGNVTATSSNTSICTTSVSGNVVTITRGNTEGSATVTISTQATSNWNAATPSSVSVTNENVHVYGASWDGTSTTLWTRTDEAANFTDPVPYVAGASSYGSPFDTLQPWAGMTKSTRNGNVVVAIPKFWYKITQNGSGMKIQIAEKEKTGYSVSPAHMDRGDGKSERDVVYVGRYHCNSFYKSATGGKPVANITRSTARASIHNTGTNIWQMDFATRFTLWLLYIVEFADWNSQAKIGYGCGNGSSTENMGYTDSMPYHTGTTKSSRTTYGLGTQYRNIEGLWDNVFDWFDGCYYNDNGLNIILNPSNFSETYNGTLVGTPSDGYPSAFTVKNVSGTYLMFIPTAASGSQTTYSCDKWDATISYHCIFGGGVYTYDDLQGLFSFLYYSDIDNRSMSVKIGCRLMELPDNS